MFQLQALFVSSMYGKIMAKKKNQRDSKQQMGQFMTPRPLAHSVLDMVSNNLTRETVVLEPSLGKGVFVFDLISRFLSGPYSDMPVRDALPLILEKNLYGVELDQELFAEFQESFYNQFQIELDTYQHNFSNIDFFDYNPETDFDIIVGNPPFGGTFNPATEDALDKQLGMRAGHKIKKETYAFFTVACLEKLRPKGQLAFILSDTFMTINTMQGLRRFTVGQGSVAITPLHEFSDETDYGMVVMHVQSSKPSSLTISGEQIDLSVVQQTPNYSWGVTPELAAYFQGESIGDYMLASSGMTIGKNELFLRPIDKGNTIVEPYDFSYSHEPITLAGETRRARLNKISEAKRKELLEGEQRGDTRKTLNWTEKKNPERIALPHADYKFYNKAQPNAFYGPPIAAIYWKDSGEAVYTFKKQGPWYLHGVGGKSFFQKEGLTWNLISSTIKARYLPSGYILDSGAPVAVLREDIDADELWFILGWLNTAAATNILKTVINHTKNIQSKDVERMPYPSWVSPQDKTNIIYMVKTLVQGLQSGSSTASDIASTAEKLEKLFTKS
jgi:predicted RNA methylase